MLLLISVDSKHTKDSRVLPAAGGITVLLGVCCLAISLFYCDTNSVDCDPECANPHFCSVATDTAEDKCARDMSGCFLNGCEDMFLTRSAKKYSLPVVLGLLTLYYLIGATG